MRYEDVMCCNCKECEGKELIRYEEAGAKVTRCKNFKPKYKFESAGISCTFFSIGAEDEDNKC